MTLLLDCNRQITKSFHRELDSHISTDGLIVTGVPLNDEDGYFVGDIQTFLIANTPDEGFLICSKYSTNCRGSIEIAGNVYATGSSLDSAEDRHRSSLSTGTGRSSSTFSSTSSSGNSYQGADGNSNNEMGESRVLATNQNRDNLLLTGSNIRGENSQSSSSGSSSTIQLNLGLSEGTKQDLSRLSASDMSSRRANGNRTSVNRANEPTDELYDYFDYGAESFLEENEEQGSNVRDTSSNRDRGNFKKKNI